MDTLDITESVRIPVSEIVITAVRSQGPGGQNVNKVASAIHLRFDSQNCDALPAYAKDRLLQISDHRITDSGVVIIKSQAYRNQRQNQRAAFARLSELLARALRKPKKRRPTKPSKAAKRKRREAKSKRAQLKQLRKKPGSD